MRVQGKCVGDCSKCKLLEAGEVDMIPCILDQMFQRVKRIEANIQAQQEKDQKKQEVKLIGDAENA